MQPKTRIALIVAAVSVFAGLSGVLVRRPPAEENVARDESLGRFAEARPVASGFVRDIGSGDFGAAYARMTVAYRARHDLESFKKAALTLGPVRAVTLRTYYKDVAPGPGSTDVFTSRALLVATSGTADAVFVMRLEGDVLGVEDVQLAGKSVFGG